MIYLKLLLIVTTILMFSGCARKSYDIKASTNKEEALIFLKNMRGTCKIEEGGIGDGMLNGAIYPYSRWSVKLHFLWESFYQPKLYLDDNRQDTPGKYCIPYHINGDPSLFVGSLMGLGVKYEKDSNENK